MSLAALLNQGTPGPWAYHTFHDDGYNEDYEDVRPEGDMQAVVLQGERCYLPAEETANLRLGALAPDMARLLIDMYQWIDDSMHKPGDDLELGHALLARFAALDAKAGETT